MYIKVFFVVFFVFVVVLVQFYEFVVCVGFQYFGIVFCEGVFNSDVQFVVIFRDIREFGQIVFENGQKWEFIQFSCGQFIYFQGDIIVNEVKRNFQFFCCYIFVWYSQFFLWGRLSVVN